MHGISSHELAIWISICVGGGASIAAALAVCFSIALRKPEEPEA